MKEQHIRIVLLILYVVGAVGMSFPKTRPWFIELSALNLLVSFIGLLISRKQDFTKFILFLFFAFTIGMTVEIIGVHTGFLFGNYTYGKALSIKWFGVPLIIGLNWGILTVTSSSIIHRFEFPRLIQVILSALLMVLFDYILEPVAVSLDYWQWKNGTIPPYNYISWFGVSLFLQWLYQKMRLPESNKVAESLFLMMFIFFTFLMI